MNLTTAYIFEICNILAQTLYMLLWTNIIMKPKYKYITNFICALVLLLGMICQVFFTNSLINIFRVAIPFTLSLFLYQGKRYINLIKISIFAFISVFCEFFCLIILSAVNNFNYVDIQTIEPLDISNPNLIYRYELMVSSILQFIIIFISFLFYSKKKNIIEIDSSNLFKYSIGPIIQTIVFYLLLNYAYTTKTAYNFTLIIIYALSIIITNAYLLKLLIDNTKKTKKIEQAKLIESQIQGQYEYYEMLCQQIQQTQKMRHDIANYMQVLDTVIKDLNNKKIIDYAENIKEQYFKSKSINVTENLIIDTLLFNKLELASKEGIEITINSVVNDFGNINDKDLVSVISNLLDNAIENCNSNSQIIFNISLISGVLIIQTQNPIFDKKEKTQKDFSYKHGLGKLIIKEICERYNGKFITQIQNNNYLAKACLNTKITGEK